MTGFYSKTFESAKKAAAFTNTAAFQEIKELLKASDTLFITTPDGVIAQIWDCIAELDMDLSNYIICHFSGSLSSYVFSGIERTNAKGCSIHPMYAFSDQYTSYLKFKTAYMTIEGDAEAAERMRVLFQGLGHKVLTIQSADKIKYHAAATLASNAVLGLMQASLDLLSDCGFSESEGMELLSPLVTGNIFSMLKEGCVKALTGPFERGDAETVKKHLEALQGKEEEAIYRSLGKKLMKLAKCKHPERDYAALERIIYEKHSKYI